VPGTADDAVANGTDGIPGTKDDVVNDDVLFNFSIKDNPYEAADRADRLTLHKSTVVPSLEAAKLNGPRVPAGHGTEGVMVQGSRPDEFQRILGFDDVDGLSVIYSGPDGDLRTEAKARLNKPPISALQRATCRCAGGCSISDQIPSQIGSLCGAPAPAARHAGALMP